MNENRRKFLTEQIEAYRNIRPTYEELCKILRNLLEIILREYISNDDFIIQGRVKTISSFAQKITRPSKYYINPLKEITDFCGIRIILNDLKQVNLICDVIRTNFLVDIENSEDKIEILKPQEFGYLSTHFIIQLFPEKDYKKRFSNFDKQISEEFLDLKSEIQIRTVLQHGWAVNQYDKTYKAKFDIPEIYLRELHKTAALLEIADASLTDLVKKLKDYESNYPSYMTKEQIHEEIASLEIVYEADKSNIDIAHKIAKMSMVVDDWPKAIKTLEDVINSEEYSRAPLVICASVQKDLGISLSKKYKKQYQTYLKEKDSAEAEEKYKEAIEKYQKGQWYLMESIKCNSEDSDAYASLGGSWKNMDNNKAYQYYKDALEVDPDDPYPLGNYLVLKIQRNLKSGKDDPLKVIKIKRESIEKGIEKRKKQIEVKVDLPWAYFDIGLFSLYLGNVQESLINYLKGIRYSQESWMIETTLKTLNEIIGIQNQLDGLNSARTMLTLALIARNITNKRGEDSYQPFIENLKQNGLEKKGIIDGPIVIVSGGTDERIERNLNEFRQNFVNAFKSFKGALISGGTPAGISGIVGDLQAAYPESIKTIGYKPARNPYDIGTDTRYFAIRETDKDDFSIFEAFQYWYDILCSGIDPSRVKLIGINGGKISALEFRLAIAFGAQVGILQDSGRAASELIGDSEWMEKVATINDEPIRLFKVIKNSEDDIYNFLTKKFIIDPDIENLRMCIIQIRTSGLSIYEKEFLPGDFASDLLASLLRAMDMMADEIRIGDIASINSKNGCITGGLIANGNFKVIFVLFSQPSNSMERKIENFLKSVDAQLAEKFTRKYMHGIVYTKHKKMAELFAKAFGQEILKFFQ